jgi:adenylate cyclase
MCDGCPCIQPQFDILMWLGRPVRRAVRLNPYHPERFWGHFGRAQRRARLYGGAIESLSKAQTTPDYGHHVNKAASLAQLGNQVAGGAHAREVIEGSRPSAPGRFLAPSIVANRQTASTCGKGF